MEFIEPNLHFIFTPDNLGHIEFEIKITPDHLKQVHSFIFEIDQSFLPKILVQCNEIIQKYEIRDKDQTFRQPIVN
jgi:hypothetical protein